MQNFRNYYQILNVAKEATPDDIKRAYRRLARQYHPDLNPGDKAAEETFKDIGEAYEILSDPDRRAKYDQFSRYWMQGSFKKNGTATKVRRGATARKSAEDVEFSQYRDFNTFIDQLLNRRDDPTVSRATTSRATPSDPFRPGTSKKSYTVPRPSPRHAEARLTVPMERAYQGGRERIRLEDGRSLEVNMPPGMLSGQKVRLKGQGVNGGDLFLKIELAPHPFFRMQGTDLYCQLPITPCEAVLGGAIEVPTLDGMVKMMVPAGVRSGQKLRMAGKGYPINGQRGDQIVEILVLVPRDISEPERELYEKLRQVETFNPRADLLV